MLTGSVECKLLPGHKIYDQAKLLMMMTIYNNHYSR